MSKVLKLLSVLLVVTLLCGCGATKEEKIVKCSLSKKDTINGYELKSDYNITAAGNIVKKVETKEVITSDTASVLDYFETTLNTTYEKFNKEYGGYTFTIKKEENTVVSDVSIDYAKMNLEKLSKDDSGMKAAMNGNNELTLDGIKAMYKSLGATCED